RTWEPASPRAGARTSTAWPCTNAAAVRSSRVTRRQPASADSGGSTRDQSTATSPSVTSAQGIASARPKGPTRCLTSRSTAPPQPEDRGLRQDATADVEGVGREPEADRRDVLFVLVHEVRRELGRLADQDGQDARRPGVERAGVADPADAESPTNERDDVERRRSRALVDDEHAGATDPHAHLADPPASGASGVPASAARTAASTTRVASASGPAIVHPA